MKPVRGIVNRVMEEVDGQTSREIPTGQHNGNRALASANRSGEPSPLRSTGFTAFPRVLDDFILRLSKHEPTRSIARVLWPVVMDLAKYTDNTHHDVVVANKGIAERRVVGEPNVKAAIRLLIKLRVVRREDASFERFQELQRNMVRFTSRMRYLVWNPQSEWKLPETVEAYDQIAALWKYVGKNRKNRYS